MKRHPPVTLTRWLNLRSRVSGLVTPSATSTSLVSIARSAEHPPLFRMAKPLRSQLNQIRAWVRQGRTDAWIAHQLEVSTNELREFRRRHELDSEEEDSGELDLRDEIEAEIEAASREEEERAVDADTEGPDEELGGREDDAGDEAGDGEPTTRRRRRRRRGGRGRRTGGAASTLQATFDHGEDEGYGLWLDPAVKDDPVYAEHWAGNRRVEVTLEPDRIVIRRSSSEDGSSAPSD
jgi:hypothetical protein